MPCFYSKAEKEKEQLRELLELANAQKEEARKASEAATQRGEELACQLAARVAELSEANSKVRWARVAGAARQG